MKVLKIKDNTQVKKDALSDIDILTGKIADKTLEQLGAGRCVCVP